VRTSGNRARTGCGFRRMRGLLGEREEDVERA
jgi:hypothetical protein